MKRWVLAAGLLAAALVPQAMAADLDDGGPPPWKGGAYGYPPPGSSPPPSYYQDEDDDGPPRGRRYTDVRPYSSGPGPSPYGSCVRSEQVRDRLTSLGWRDFHSGKAVSQTTVMLRARRPGGRMFELKLDRCSGEVLAMRPLDFRLPPYAYKSPGVPYGSDRWEDTQRPPPYTYGRPDSYGPYADGGPYANGQRWRDRPYYGGQRRWEND